MRKIDEILNFWFSTIDDTTLIDKKADPFRKWFIKDEAFDQQIRENFENDLIRARNGEYKDWENDVNGRLALIILWDQFSRNLYRGTPKMFENDLLALRLALKSIDDKMDQKSPLIHRVFLYMPLMHSEDRHHQELSLKYFGQLVEECKQKNPVNVSYYEYSFNYAKQHHHIVERFGRFPHRNKILARPSTNEEIEFLKRSGSSF